MQYMATAKFFFNAPDGLTQEQADAHAKQAVSDFKSMTWAMGDAAVIHGQGTPSEETSYAAIYRVEPDDRLTTLDGWHLDDDGVLQDGLPE